MEGDDGVRNKYRRNNKGPIYGGEYFTFRSEAGRAGVRHTFSVPPRERIGFHLQRG